MERTVRLIEQAIRCCTVKINEDVDKSARPGLEEEAYLKASSTVPDEEELVTRPGLSRFHKSGKLMDEFDPELEELALGNPEEVGGAYGTR